MKYIDVKIAGLNFVRAFPNKKKNTPKQPDYKGDGVAVWIKESKKKG